MSEESKSNSVLLKLLSLPFMVAISIINSGYAASLSWNLFVPKYFGLPELSVHIAVATIATLSILVPKTSTSEEDGTKLVAMFFGHIIVVWIAYFVVLISTSLYF